jgi:hypothetical protein
MPRLVHQQRLHAASLGGGASITTEDGRRLKSTWVNAEGMLVPYDFAADVAFHKVHAPELWAVLEAVLQTTGGKSELNSMKRYAQSCATAGLEIRPEFYPYGKTDRATWPLGKVNKK